MSVFDIIGPVMIGPSSSHTAGAARIGMVARRLLGDCPDRALITLHGSFADTAVGHGTDRALIGGLLGFGVSDMRLRDSFDYAEKSHLKFEFRRGDLGEVHPNTALVELWRGEKRLTVLASSVGGGSIHVQQIDGADVSFSAKYHTLVVFSIDKPGTVAALTKELACNRINIAFMRLFREDEGKSVVMVIETDSAVSCELCSSMEQLEHIEKIVYLPPLSEE